MIRTFAGVVAIATEVATKVDIPEGTEALDTGRATINPWMFTAATIDIIDDILIPNDR